ncbi:MAG: type II secretion system protein GspD, partial [Sinobacterium sp.]|nr:type II secretion system protein GspD [Sinobacterium sp.]
MEIIKNSVAKAAVTKLITGFAMLLLSAVVLAESYTVNFKDADIKDLIKFVADATGYTVVIDPKVKGNIQLISKEPVSEKELYNLFLSVLHAHNFSAIKNGNVLRIIPNKLARSAATPVRTRKPRIANHEYITQIIELKNVNATKLIPVLRPLVPQQGHMAAYADANAIIITDTADNVAKLYKIIASLDKTTANEMEIFRLTHSSADDFVKIADKVIKQPASSGKGSSSQRASIVADKRSNSIIVTGSEQQRLKVRRLIEELDGPLQSSGNAQVFSLKYANAKDLAPVLSKVSQSLLKIGGDAKAKGGSVQAASIEADEATNSLIITASGDVLESLTNIIEKLDVQRAQVLVEAIIVEIFETDGKALGVNWMLAGEKSGFAGSVHQEGILGALAQGAFEDDEDDAVKGIAAALANMTGGVLGGANFDVGGTSFVALLNALETSQEANILS